MSCYVVLSTLKRRIESIISNTYPTASFVSIFLQNPSHCAESLVLGSFTDLNMQNIRKSILTRVNLRRSTERWFLTRDEVVHMQLRCWCSSTAVSSDQILDRVIALAKKYDKMDGSKVTETADFQKDLNLDSLDRVELIMALEEEFSIEIPDEKADKLVCCADVAKYIAEVDQKNVQKP
ncbi:Acyl carrier protein 3, mitochondrial [Glycine max]|nr:Acyl carrier protein 3, mitochondrial [Glycine max]